MSIDHTHASVLTSDLLCELAGEVTYARGLAYAQDGRVQELTVEDGVLSARVRGTQTYTVRLDSQKPRLSYDCTCPVGEELRFCKHCVAVGVAWLLDRDGGVDQPARREPAENPTDGVRAFLERQDAESLRALLLAEANRNESLHERLLLRAATEERGPESLRALRDAIDRATAVADFIEYHEAPAYAGMLDQMVDGIEAMAKANPAAAVELAEHAIWRVEEVIAGMDDSDGLTLGILERLQEIHFDACVQAKPDPVTLARRLFKGEMRAEYDSFFGAAGTYADVLGEAGLAEYRRLARAEWDRVPALKPGERDTNPGVRRWTITHMMEGLAEASGDVEEMVAVRSRDLSQPHAFLQIAELYRQARNHDKAMEWARRGLESFPSNQDSRLRTFLAEEHHRRGQHEQAMNLVWQVFTAWPHLENYELLKQHADRSAAWKTWRERALERIRQEAARRITIPGAYGLSVRDPGSRTELVRVFLWEEDVEQAWREAQEGGCSPELWLKLAALRKADHPQDSLAVYHKQVDRILIDTGERAYADAIKLLPHVRELMDTIGEDFAAWLAGLRTTHKRRRKLMEMLDRFEKRPVRR